MTIGNGILYSSGTDMFVRTWHLDSLEEIGSIEVSIGKGFTVCRIQALGHTSQVLVGGLVGSIGKRFSVCRIQALGHTSQV